VHISAFLISLSATFFSAAGESQPLDTCLPADSMAVYFARPTPEMLNAPPGGQVDRLAGWLTTLNSVGVIPEQGRFFADVIGTMPLLSRRPHAFALLDITSYKYDERSYKLNTMQAALLIDRTGMETAIERRVRTLLATYADAENGQVKTLTHGEHTYYRLVDERLPDWATPEWAPIDSLFVIAFGKGTLAKILNVINGKSTSLGSQPWFSKAHKRLDGANRGFEIYINFQRIRQRVGEVVKDRPEHVLAALRLQNCKQLLWTIGYTGRSMGSEMVIRNDRKNNKYLRIAGKQLADPAVLRAIPPQAFG